MIGNIRAVILYSFGVGFVLASIPGGPTCVADSPNDVLSPASGPHRQAHAHNDYAHERPLREALSHGFCSVEADVHLVDGELLVAHDLENTDPAKTLRRLYLEPLAAAARRHGGRVYRDGPRFTLLIDIKSDAEPTYRVLDRQLRQYESVWTCYRDGESEPGAVTVIVSGNRPESLMAGQSVRFAAVDGRLSDLAADKPKSLMPLISDRWSSHFDWRGEGPLPVDEQRKLESLVEQVHGQGKRIRFWAIPDQPAGWRAMRDAGVDLINTDKLAELAALLSEPSGTTPLDPRGK